MHAPVLRCHPQQRAPSAPAAPPQEVHRKNYITPDDLPDQHVLRSLIDSGAIDDCPGGASGGSGLPSKFVSRAEHAAAMKQQLTSLRNELQADYDGRLEALDAQHRQHLDTTLTRVRRRPAARTLLLADRCCMGELVLFGICSLSLLYSGSL